MVNTMANLSKINFKIMDNKTNNQLWITVIIKWISNNITICILSKMAILNNRTIKMLDNTKTCRKQIKKNNFKIAKEMSNKMMKMNKEMYKNKMMKVKMKVVNMSSVKILKEEMMNNKTMIILIQMIIKMETLSSLILIMRKKGKI